MRTVPRLYQTALLLLTLPGALAAACKSKQPLEDPQKLVILKATWGAIDDTAVIDVTQKLAAMVRDNMLQLQATSQVLGEPASFKLKELRVNYTKGGIFAKKRVSEKETLIIPLDEKPVPIRLVVHKALYGNLESDQTIDVTKHVTDRVLNNTLSVTPTNALFGDPARFRSKELRVDYTFDGLARSKTAKEREALTISNTGE